VALTTKPDAMLKRFILLSIVFTSCAFCQTNRPPLVPNSLPGQPTVHTGLRRGSYSPCAPVEKGKFWRDAKGQFKTLEDLRRVLQSHNAWAWSRGGEQADLSNVELCNADLHDLNLRGIKLQHAKLAGSNLERADLAGADLSDADLSGADLQGAIIESAKVESVLFIGANLQHIAISNSDLRSANFVDADLRGAMIRWSRLEGSYFHRTNASGAAFWQVELPNALISDSELSGAYLFASDVNGVVFEPTSLPAIRQMATSLNLESLTYSNNPDGLFQLRKQFQDGGFLLQERQTTYALKRTQSNFRRLAALQTSWVCTSLRPLISEAAIRDLTKRFGSDIGRGKTCSYWRTIADWVDYRFDQALFDWTCRYGLEPSRSLRLLLAGIGLWSLAYLFFMQLPARWRSGVYYVLKSESSAAIKTKISLHPTVGVKLGLTRALTFLKTEFGLIRLAVMFSLMSAFNIGFREISFGHWIRLLTIEEYDLKAEGWARPVSGLQSLFSVAMVALWFLSYFGRPFAQ
jgi:uncharacterized protein YjbI with pentapeptide repeats